MPSLERNGVRLAYQVSGAGKPVVMVMGSGAGGRVWHLHQVPALVAAGYQVITFDNRGIAGSGLGDGRFTIQDMADDIAELVNHLRLAPCAVIGFSLGAFVVQELLLTHPDLVDRGVLMATRGRDDAFRAAISAADRTLHDDNGKVPAAYRAVATMARSLSRATLNDESLALDWLEILEVSDVDHPGYRRQLELDSMPDRLADYRAITVPTMVLAFAEDVLCPPHLAREVADAIPGAAFTEVPGCGHFGYLERPDEVNSRLLDFLADKLDMFRR